MKKFLIIPAIAALLLSGCGTPDTYPEKDPSPETAAVTEAKSSDPDAGKLMTGVEIVTSDEQSSEEETSESVYVLEKFENENFRFDIAEGWKIPKSEAADKFTCILRHDDPVGLFTAECYGDAPYDSAETAGKLLVAMNIRNGKQFVSEETMTVGGFDAHCAICESGSDEKSPKRYKEYSVMANGKLYLISIVGLIDSFEETETQAQPMLDSFEFVS